MAIQTSEPITKYIMDEYIVVAAKATDYEKGFGIQGCNLSKPIWWASYYRQSLDQQTLNKKTKEETRRVLDTIRYMNLENVSFSDKQNLIAKLGIKVYPSEDKKVVRISSIIQPDPCPFKFSPQKINMTSPKL